MPYRCCLLTVNLDDADTILACGICTSNIYLRTAVHMFNIIQMYNKTAMQPAPLKQQLESTMICTMLPMLVNTSQCAREVMLNLISRETHGLEINTLVGFHYKNVHSE
jgi:hypothetical protein